MSEPWLTKAELAAELKISKRTIERLRLPAWRVGGQNRYRMTEIEGFLRGEGGTSNIVELRMAATPVTVGPTHKWGRASGVAGPVAAGQDEQAPPQRDRLSPTQPSTEMEEPR